MATATTYQPWGEAQGYKVNPEPRAKGPTTYQPQVRNQRSLEGLKARHIRARTDAMLFLPE
jgi:hypothetical protein